MLEEQLGRRGDAVAPLRPVLLRTLADVQERLTFRAQAFIKVIHLLSTSQNADYAEKGSNHAIDTGSKAMVSWRGPMHVDCMQEEVTGFQPKPDDLDYPNKLERSAEQPETAVPESQAEQLPLMTDSQNASTASSSTVSTAPCYSALTAHRSNTVCPSRCMGMTCVHVCMSVCGPDCLLCWLQRESAMNAYNTWYPPVQKTLLCLSKLYRCVEARVFAGLAQDAVSSCAAAVQVTRLSHPRTTRL